MARGGKREGAGRKPGQPNLRGKKLEETIAVLTKGKKASEKGPVVGVDIKPGDIAVGDIELPSGDDLLPLEFMLAVVRCAHMPFGARMDAATAAAPYIHSKLSTVDMKAKVETVTQEDALKALR